MANIIFITGGARSGKSTYAEKIASEKSSKVLYIATAIPIDEEMKHRIKKHKASRPAHWITYEGYNNLNNAVENYEWDVALLDCITIMISNLLFDKVGENIDNFNQQEIDIIEKNILQEVSNLLDFVEVNSKTLIIVSNEIGFGLVPEYKLGRIYRDIVGRINQYIAKRSKEVYLVVSGINIRIK